MFLLVFLAIPIPVASAKKHNDQKLLFYRRYLGILNSLVKYFTQGITKYQNTVLSLYNIFLLHCTPNKMKRGDDHTYIQWE